MAGLQLCIQEELDKQSRQEDNGQSAQMEMDIPTETLVLYFFS
jgi:hypothetical protein